MTDARLMVATIAGDGDADGAGCRRERERERDEKVAIKMVVP